MASLARRKRTVAIVTALQGGGYTAAAAALFTRMTATDARKSQINSEFVTIDDAIADLDGLWRFNAEDATQAKLNWLSATYGLTEVSAPVFTPNVGYKGDGIDDVLQTGINPSTFGGKYTKDDASLGVFILDNADGAAVTIDFGALGGTGGTDSYIGNATAAANLILPNLAANSGAVPQSGLGMPNGYVGLITAVKTSPTTVDYYAGKLYLGTGTVTAGNLSNNLLTFMGRTASLYSSRSLGGGFVGRKLTAAKIAKLATAFMSGQKATNGFRKDIQVVCYGNSLTDGVNVTDKFTQSYPAQLQALYNAQSASVNVLRRGIGGQTTPQLNAYLDTDLIVRAATQYPARRRIFVFWEGYNDIYNGATPSQAVDHYQDAMIKARAMLYPGDKILVCNDIAHKEASNFTNAKRLAFNAELLSRYASWADGYIDLASVTQLQDQTNTTYFDADQIHLTAAGMTAVAGKIKPAVDAQISAA